jgi:hypothetical protein
MLVGLFREGSTCHLGSLLSEESRQLLRTLFVHAIDCPDLDAIVVYVFFARSSYPAKIDNTSRTKPLMSLTSESDIDELLYQQPCQYAGIGRDIKGEYWPCAGADKVASIERELLGMAAG